MTPYTEPHCAAPLLDNYRGVALFTFAMVMAAILESKFPALLPHLLFSGITMAFHTAFPGDSHLKD